jgi:hypothetical protein
MHPRLRVRLVRLGLSTLTAATFTACAEEPEVGAEVAALGVCGNGVQELRELCVAAPTTVRATPEPVGAVLGVDLDGDGHRDLVAVTPSRQYIVYGTGLGFGIYAWVTPGGVGALHDVATGDFDGDGDLDVAMTDTPNDRILLRFQTAPRVFAASVSLPTGDAPTRLLAARMNADVRDDLVVLNRDADTVDVRLAAGAGAFAAALTYAVGDATDLALGDCDGTTRPDLMYMNGQGTSATLRARRNQGNGALGPIVTSAFPLGPTATIPSYSSPLAITAGRMNPGIAADAVVAATESRLATALSNGNCTFVKQPEIQTWAWTYRLRAVDFDGDGTLDVTAPHGTGAADDRLSLAFGLGNGLFDPSYGSIVQPLGTLFNDAAVHDWNGDGFPDLVTASAAGLLLFRGAP